MITWTDDAWSNFIKIYNENHKLIKKIVKIVEDIDRNGYNGIGKPEPLKGDLSGFWSRRIDSKNRIVYKIENDIIKIVQCGTHYGEK